MFLELFTIFALGSGRNLDWMNTVINMYTEEGYWNVRPKIKRLSFPKRGKFQVDLQDGRSVTMPISAFPSLKRVPAKERENWYLMGGGVTWDSCSEVIHIEQILGNYQNYAHEQV